MKYFFLILVILHCGCHRNTHHIRSSDIHAPVDSKIYKKEIIVIDAIRDSSNIINPNIFYEKAYSELENMLINQEKISFKKAVFITENAWFENKNDYEKFCSTIKEISSLILSLSKINKLNYTISDSVKVKRNAAIYRFFTDTTIIITSEYSRIHFPFQYNFSDSEGINDWSNMFVRKLLKTNNGNCHNLPYLYKIIADEIETEAYLTLAPNHIYLKHRSKKTGWYNTELTSGQFPIDGWIMASGYIPLEAIQNGIYMDTLGDKQNISLCLIDLAKGYERKFGDNKDEFIIKCCDLALQYYPNYINAMLLKAETQKRRFDRLMKQYNVQYPSELFYLSGVKQQYAEMEQLYLKIYDLGYREMPKEMYQQWLQSLKEEQEKYGNKKINFKN